MADVPVQPGKVGWLGALSSRYWRAPSVLALIAANLLPLYGVLYWGWDLFVLMMAYWIETGIIGFFTAVRMVLVSRWVGALLVMFFIIHFGGFMAAHFVFLWALFSGEWRQDVSGFGNILYVLLVGTGLWVACVALFLSHGVSFHLNVLRPMRAAVLPDDPPGKPLTAGDVMMMPYPRIVVMHLTIVLGAFLIQMFGTRFAPFALLIGLKIVADVAAHVRTNFAQIEARTR